MFSIDLAFSKDIFKNNATISLNAQDLLNSRKRRSTRSTEGIETYSEHQWRQRQVNLSLIYRFNQQKKRERPNTGFGGGDDDMGGF